MILKQRKSEKFVHWELNLFADITMYWFSTGKLSNFQNLFVIKKSQQLVTFIFASSYSKPQLSTIPT